jgi:hypothetical protein
MSLDSLLFKIVEYSFKKNKWQDVTSVIEIVPYKVCFNEVINTEVTLLLVDSLIVIEKGSLISILFTLYNRDRNS